MSSGAVIFAMGPAGSGKSTFCASVIQHFEEKGRQAHLINLDPAAEDMKCTPSKDIRDLICVDDAMEELQYGPNGGLIFCLEYLLENLEWLTDDLGQYQDEYLVVDCPGQIELYTHSDIMSRIVAAFQSADYKPCAVYLMESLFLQDITKYFAGVLTASSCMLQLAIPFINVLSKMDLLSDGIGEEDEEDDSLLRYFDPDPSLLEERLTAGTPVRFVQLNSAIVNLIDELGLVSFVPLDIRKESSLELLVLRIDMATQYSEGLEPKEPDFND